MIKGRCECAKVQYQVAGELKDYCHCHCSICRRLHGAAFATWGGVVRAEFSYTAGQDNLNSYSFSDNADSLFCKDCGSSLIFQDDISDNHEIIHFSAGTLNTHIDIKPDVHIYVESKASWLELQDDLPKFETGRSSKRVD